MMFVNVVKLKLFPPVLISKENIRSKLLASEKG